MKIKINYHGREIPAEQGEILADALINGGVTTSHPCGGKGVCGKCRVLVDGIPALACKYTLTHDVTVSAEIEGEFHSDVQDLESEAINGTDLVLDLGTTTLALALVDKNKKSTVKVITAPNPQRSFGADIISRIEYCQRNGVDNLTRSIRDEINRLICEMGVTCLDTLYVAGNATMLHIFSGVDPSPMGVAPYEPSFLCEITEPAQSLGISGVKAVRLLPSVSAFVGADVVAGISYVGLPMGTGYRLLVDLGTNAEIALFSMDKIITTSAAAGPCFEGACISSGMGATDGAIYSYDGITAKTVNGSPARGICGTGLVDVVAFLLSRAKIDASGRLDEEELELAEGISVTAEDIRQYQLAKSAIYSAILTVMQGARVDFSDIEALYISGGFSTEINAKNAALTGLIPRELADKCHSIGNSSLLGAIRAIFEGDELSEIAGKAIYVDLSTDTAFADLFIKNMSFNK